MSLSVDTLNKIVEKIIRVEGEYSDHPSDKGGPTRWGITQETAIRNGYTKDMRYLPREKAVEIYRIEYIQRPGFDKIWELDGVVGEEVIDSGVNCGVSRSGMWFQRALNAANRQQKDYPNIGVDGIIGHRSVEAFKALIRKRGMLPTRQYLLRCLNGLQTAHYFACVENNEKNEDFMWGWIINRVS